jgi:hypothetical protein
MRDGSNAEEDGKSGDVSTRAGVHVYNSNLAVEQVCSKSVPHLSLKTACVHASTPILAKTIPFCSYKKRCFRASFICVISTDHQIRDSFVDRFGLGKTMIDIRRNRCTGPPIDTHILTFNKLCRCKA